MTAAPDPLRILFITTTLPHRRTNGGEIATASLIDGIRACGHEVEVLGYTRAGDPAPDRVDYHSARDWPIETELAGARKWLWLARAWLTGAPYVVTKFRSRAMRRAARRLYRRHRFDVVVIDHLQLGWIADDLYLPERRIGVAHNVEHTLLAEQAQDPRAGRLKRVTFARDATLMKGFERRLAAGLDQLWTLTGEERQSFLALAGTSEADVRVIPLPGQSFPAPAAMPPPTIDIVVLGSWVWEVNRRGLAWFVAEVAPLLPPGLRVVVGGKGSDQVPHDRPNVAYAGFVPDAAEFLRSGRVICIPSVMGAGIQLKSIEGMSIGRPVVTTALGLRGIAPLPPHVHVVADARAMAARLAELSRGPVVDESAAAARWSAARHEAFRQAMAAALSSLEGA